MQSLPLIGWTATVYRAGWREGRERAAAAYWQANILTIRSMSNDASTRCLVSLLLLRILLLMCRSCVKDSVTTNMAYQKGLNGELIAKV